MAFVTCSKLIEVLIDQINQATQEQRDRLCEALGCCVDAAPPAASCNPAANINATYADAVPIDPGDFVVCDGPFHFSAVNPGDGQVFDWTLSFLEGPPITLTGQNVSTAGNLCSHTGSPVTVTLEVYCDIARTGTPAIDTFSFNISGG